MDEIIGSLENSTTGAAPHIQPYLPDPARRNGIGVIIFPGGGYEGLADYEGKDYAEFLCDQGIAGFVVTYRLAPGFKHPAMLEDALAAIATVRSRAAEFGLNPSMIGVMGSSAGGHLAAHSMVGYGDYKSSVSLRPDFGILCYPVISMQGDFCHGGSRWNLIGKEAPESLMRKVSCEEQVGPDTPPCFLWHTWEDPAVPVENSLMFASSLRRYGVPFEMHIYPKGVHGLALRTELPWARDCVRWLKELAGEA